MGAIHRRGSKRTRKEGRCCILALGKTCTSKVSYSIRLIYTITVRLNFLSRCAGIDHKKNIVLTCSHPSPLSAYKTDEPFIGSRIFSRCNEALESLGKTPIDWNVR